MVKAYSRAKETVGMEKINGFISEAELESIREEIREEEHELEAELQEREEEEELFRRDKGAIDED